MSRHEYETFSAGLFRLTLSEHALLDALIWWVSSSFTSSNHAMKSSKLTSHKYGQHTPGKNKQHSKSATKWVLLLLSFSTVVETEHWHFGQVVAVDAGPKFILSSFYPLALRVECSNAKTKLKVIKNRRGIVKASWSCVLSISRRQYRLFHIFRDTFLSGARIPTRTQHRNFRAFLYAVALVVSFKYAWS